MCEYCPAAGNGCSVCRDEQEVEQVAWERLVILAAKGDV
jgi:hypothetical protein